MVAVRDWADLRVMFEQKHGHDVYVYQRRIHLRNSTGLSSWNLVAATFNPSAATYGPKSWPAGKRFPRGMCRRTPLVRDGIARVEPLAGISTTSTCSHASDCSPLNLRLPRQTLNLLSISRCPSSTTITGAHPRNVGATGPY